MTPQPFPDDVLFVNNDVSVEEHYALLKLSDYNILKHFGFKQSKRVSREYFKTFRKNISAAIKFWDGVDVIDIYKCKSCGCNYEPYDCRICGRKDVYQICRECHNKKAHKKIHEYNKKKQEIILKKHK